MWHVAYGMWHVACGMLHTESVACIILNFLSICTPVSNTLHATQSGGMQLGM
jgi:hypothetical protein